jgi:mannose-6-phosphate isomerase-like protein (cupin superfamily)
MDRTVKKIDSRTSPSGAMGQKYLVSGTRVALRLWEHADRTKDRAMHSRPYETVGYVLEGRARLHLGAQTVALEPGDAYLVPADAEHSYEIVEAPFRSLEATSPPARVKDRDEPQRAH